MVILRKSAYFLLGPGRYRHPIDGNDLMRYMSGIGGTGGCWSDVGEEGWEGSMGTGRTGFAPGRVRWGGGTSSRMSGMG